MRNFSILLLVLLVSPCEAQTPRMALSPWVEAVLSGSEEEVSLLIGADRSLDTPLSQGKTALALAAEFNPHPGVIAALLRSGASLETRDAKGRTPLMAAALRNTAVIVETLLAAGADPQAQDLEGRTAADLSNGNRKLVGTKTFWTLYHRRSGARS